jgi:hypothetical protein
MWLLGLLSGGITSSGGRTTHCVSFVDHLAIKGVKHLTVIFIPPGSQYRDCQVAAEVDSQNEVPSEQLKQFVVNFASARP